MLDLDLLAIRPGGTDHDGTNAAVPLGPAPPPVAPSPRRSRLAGRLGLGTAASLLVHAALLLAFPALWRSMIRDVAAPESITVELVDRVPGETPKVEPKEERPPPKPEPPPPAPIAKEEPPPPAAMPVPTQPDAVAEALQSGLVAPPPEAKAAASQPEVNQRANAATAPVKADPSPPDAKPEPAPTGPEPPAAAPAAPAVLTAPEADATVPAASTDHADDPKPPAAAPAAPAAATTTALAAALPMSGLPMPSTFRSALSAFGMAENANYRGSVFGALSRARQNVDAEARARRLTGQVVLAVVLTETGAIAKVSVVQSSGHADADAFALTMVRRAAPFPPPPPGVSRTFTPAVTFGDS